MWQVAKTLPRLRWESPTAVQWQNGVLYVPETSQDVLSARHTGVSPLLFWNSSTEAGVARSAFAPGRAPIRRVANGVAFHTSKRQLLRQDWQRLTPQAPRGIICEPT